MASSNTNLDSKPQLSYDTSVMRRSLHAFGKIKAKARLFRKAGPAFRGFGPFPHHDLSSKFGALIAPLEQEEKQLEKELLTIEGLSCVRCTLAFSSEQHLESHRYFCGNPHILAGDLKALKKHHNLLEDNGGMLFCPWCPLLCLNMVALFKHVRSCREAQRERGERKILQRLPCPECPTDFSHLQKLSNHMQSHYVADFTCDACKKSFPSANFLAKHLAGCKSKKPFRCSDCDRTFSNPKPLRLHVLSCRTTVQCLKCAKFFPGKFLCVEHVVMHIFSEWAKNGMQMFDGVLYRILHHKLPQEELYPSPCASPIPDPVSPKETLNKVVSSKADSRANSQEPALGLNKKKASTSDNLASKSSKSLSTILASDQGSDMNSVASDKAASLNRTLKTNIVSTSLDPPISDKAPEGIPLADEDNFSVIENEVYEIEHTIDEDEFLSEQELCDSVNQLPVSETSERLENTVQTETQQNLSDLAELFTPAIDIENGDTDKLTLTVVNVEGGANLFDWDDCDTEEVNCDDTEVGEPQTETSDFTSTAENSNNVPLCASNENDGNEDEDSGIGATDDSDSNKDRSEVPDKYDDTSKPQEELPEPLVDTGGAEEPSYLVTSSEIFVSSSSCDTEVVVETSPVMEMVIQKNYSVFAEHCYFSPPVVQGTSKHTKNKKSSESGKSRKIASKKCSIEDTDESSREELDPLQNILSDMSKEARQKVSKKSKSLKHSSASMKPVLVKTPHTIEEGLASRLPSTVQCEKQSNTRSEVHVEPQNNISVAENCTVSNHSLTQPQLKYNVACQSVQPTSNENDVHIMVQEETVTAQKKLTREDFLERVRPPMSLDKMMRKERSMLRHGFKQIATVLPQRKEPCGPKDASIPSSSATPMSVKPSVQTTDVSAKQTPAENLLSSNIIQPNIIYVQIPPNESPNYIAVSQYGALVVPTTPQPPVVVARCMPTISVRLPSSNNRFVRPRPTQYRLQIQPQPKEGVPTVTRISPAFMHQSTSSNDVVSGSYMEEAPQTPILQVAPSGSKSTGSKIMAMFGGSAPSRPVSRPVFARILPSVSSAAVPNESSTLLIDANLNSLPPEETLSCIEYLLPEETSSISETLPPVQETSQTSHLPSINSEVDQSKEVAIPQQGNHLEGNHLNPNMCGNNDTNVEDSVPVVETSLLDESSISLPDSNFNALSPEETLSSKENLPPAQDIGGLAPSGPVSEVKTGHTVLQRSRPLESNNISHNCNQLAVEKAPETKSLKAVEESVLLATECKLGMLESPAPVHDFVEEIAECNDSALDHSIKDLISCLDNNIATEESGKQEDQTVNSEKIPTTEVPSTVDLQTVLESSENGTLENHDVAKEADPAQMSIVALPKSFEVCHMQLCDSNDQVEFAFESVTNVDKPTNDANLSAVGKYNYSPSKKYKHTLMSHFQTNMCVSRKVMSEMKCFKRKRYGREGLHQSRNNVITFNCNHCSQWSYSEEGAKMHTCLRAMIEEKISSKQCDKLIDHSSEAKIGGDEVAPKPIECQAASNSSNQSPYLSYLQMKSTIRHKKFVCDKCKIRCKSFSALLEHKSKAHDEQYSVECHICSKKFSRLQQLAVHVAKKHKPASNPSVQTPVQLIKERAMKRSLSRKAALGLTKRHHSRGGFSRTVQKGKHPSLKTDLQVAENKSTKTSTPCTSEKSEAGTAQSSPAKEREFPTAPNSLASGSTVEGEWSNEETPVITDGSSPDKNIPNDYVPCTICNKLYKGRLGLSSHMVQAHRELTRSEDATIQCTVCSKSFKGRSGLTSHMNQAHRETFKCPLCLRRFCYVETMELHLKRDHPTSNINIDALTLLQPVKYVGSVVSPSKLGEGESSRAPMSEKEEALLPPSTAENSSGAQINNVIREVTDDVPLIERKIIKPKETELKFVEQEIPSLEQADEKVETLSEFNTAENGSATQSNNTIPEVTENVPLMERKIIKPKITKYKFVEETSPEKTLSPEQIAASSSGTLNTSPDMGSIRKIKKVKWKIVKDSSPEKIPGPERAAKLPRLSDGQTESVPPLVLSLRKGKKHRFKCSICWKQYKKQEHLIQHQMRAHKPTSQLSSEKKGDHEEEMAAAPTQDQHPLTLGVPNCTTNLEVPNVCGAESNSLTHAVQFSVPDSVQSSSENVVPIQEESFDSGEKSIEKETGCPPHDLPKEEINPSAPAVIPSQDHISPPPQDNSPSAKLECAICQIEFSSRGYLERHNIQVHGAPCQFRCTSCDKIFVDKRSLIFHKNSKHKQEEKDENTELLVKAELQRQRKPKRQCDECDKKFKNYHELRQHKRKVHKTPHHLKCTVCGLYLRTKKLVAVHKLKVHGISSEEKTPGPLDSPQKSNDENPVVNDSALETEKEEGTAEEKEESVVLQKEFKCMDCSLTFKYAASLQRHRKSVHVARDIHSCEVCGKRYTYAGSLEQHMKKEHVAQPQRQSRRSLRKLAESEEQNQSTNDTLEPSTDPPISPSSEGADKNEVSDCPPSEVNKQEENSAKPEETNCSGEQENLVKPETWEKPLDRDTIHNTTSHMEDLQQSSGGPCLAAENVGHQENGSHTFMNHVDPAPFDRSLTSSTAPMESYSSTINYDTPAMPPVPVGPLSNAPDYQFSSAPQVPQYQVTSVPHFQPPSMPMPPAVDQFPTYNPCSLCGLCLPSWYALQEHYYVFHAYPNNYNYYVAPAPTPPAPAPTPAPYAPSFEYPAYPNQNVAYNNWLPQQQQLQQQQQQFTNLATNTVFNSGPTSLQELSSHSGAHCSVCGMRFPSLYALQEHYATHMAGPKPAVQYSGSFY